MRRAAITDVYEVRMLVEVQAARLAAHRRTPDDISAPHAALAARRAAAPDDTAGFVDADIALHAAVLAAAHNPVLTDLFTEFVPALRAGLVNLVDLLDLRAQHPQHGDEAHAALVAAVERGDADAAGEVLTAELDRTLAHLNAC